MSYLKSFLLLLFGLIMGFWIGYRRNSDIPAVIPAIDTIKVTVHDHLPPVPKIYFLPIPMEADTQAILKDYFSSKIYNDTIINLPNLTVSLIDSVSQNQLRGRWIDYSYVPELVVREPAYQLSVSAMAGYRSLPLFLEFQNERWGLLAGYDFVNKSPMLGIKYRFAAWN